MPALKPDRYDDVLNKSKLTDRSTLVFIEDIALADSIKYKKKRAELAQARGLPVTSPSLDTDPELLKIPRGLDRQDFVPANATPQAQTAKTAEYEARVIEYFFYLQRDGKANRIPDIDRAMAENQHKLSIVTQGAPSVQSVDHDLMRLDADYRDLVKSTAQQDAFAYAAAANANPGNPAAIAGLPQGVDQNSFKLNDPAGRAQYELAINQYTRDLKRSGRTSTIPEFVSLRQQTIQKKRERKQLKKDGYDQVELTHKLKQDHITRDLFVDFLDQTPLNSATGVTGGIKNDQDAAKDFCAKLMLEGEILQTIYKERCDLAGIPHKDRKDFTINGKDNPLLTPEVRKICIQEGLDAPSKLDKDFLSKKYAECRAEMAKMKDMPSSLGFAVGMAAGLMYRAAVDYLNKKADESQIAKAKNRVVLGTNATPPTPRTVHITATTPAPTPPVTTPTRVVAPVAITATAPTTTPATSPATAAQAAVTVTAQQPAAPTGPRRLGSPGTPQTNNGRRQQQGPPPINP